MLLDKKSIFGSKENIQYQNFTKVKYCKNVYRETMTDIDLLLFTTLIKD